MNKLIYLIELIYLRILRYNLKLIINNYVSKIELEKSSEHLKIVNDLKKNGYVIIENFLPLDKCKKVINIINDYIKNNDHKIWKEDKNDSDLRLFGAEKIDELINEFNKNDKILKIGNLHIKSSLKNIFTLAGKTSFSEKNNYGSGGGWHRDSINPSFKSMLYLTDVYAGDGNLQIIENSNKFKSIIKLNGELNKKLLNTRFSNDEINFLIEKFNLKIDDIHGKAGTLILFDGSYIHRGSPIVNNTRYALTNYFHLNIDVDKIKYPSPMI
tara:strand:+ start:6959 stop:7768 length:810 start_codon:yes stop_codon:yes gene_type:complete